MRFSDLFLLSTRMFKARTSRTFLTILGMSVGIGAIIFLVSLGYGLQNTILQKITTSDSLLTLDVSPDKSSTSALDETTLEKIKELGGVYQISPSFQLTSQGQFNDLTTDVASSMVDPLYLKLQGLKLSAGELINDSDKGGIIVSSSVAQVFGKSPAEIIGQEMSFVFFVSSDEQSFSGGAGASKENMQKYVPDKKFKIIGVVETDENLVYVNSGHLPDLKPQKYDQVKVRCRADNAMGEVKNQLEQMGFLVSSLSETVDQANKVFTVVKVVLMLFGIIALIVSAIGMFNTMTITLLERTEEIGIMKSIGASNSMVSLMFIMEATIMGFLGGLVGVIIGFLEGQVFNAAVNLIATHFGGEKVDLFYSPTWFVMTVIIFSAFVGFLTGVVPARRASNIDPLDALRYK